MKQETKTIHAAHEQHQIDMLLNGDIDFLEAGDCRVPGLPSALRARASWDPKRPIALYSAATSPGQGVEILCGADEAYEKLRERENALHEQQGMGPAARIFTVKLRKAFTF